MREIEVFVRNDDGSIHKHLYAKVEDDEILKAFSAMVAAYKFEIENNINR